MSPSSERTRARLEALRQAPGEVAVVAYTEQELAEREALAAAKALGRAWRRGAPRSVRVKLLGRLGVYLGPTERHSPANRLVQMLIDSGQPERAEQLRTLLEMQTLSGGFQVRWMGDRVQALDHEPFELTRRIPSRAPDARRSD